VTRSATRTLFDLWSGFYDLPVVQRFVYRVEHDAVMDRLSQRAAAPETVVDLGCGTGLLTVRLQARWPQARVVGCDFSGGMLREASERDAPVRWVRGDASALPVRSESVDVLTCTESFHWYPDQRQAMAEVRRVLRPAGQALITLVNPSLRSASWMTERLADSVGQRASFPTRDQMRSLAADAGLHVAHQAPVRLIPVGMAPVLTVVERRR
jgi:ubiquinone/menaquinone biosynthesis C-methylase UbiE